MDEKQKLTNNIFNIVPSLVGRVMFVSFSALSHTESNLHQPNILSGRMTRPNSPNLTDEFSLT